MTIPPGRACVPSTVAVLTALVTVFVIGPGCTVCDAAPCFSSLSLTFEEPGHASLRSGSYEIELVLDGEEVATSCEVDSDAESVVCGDVASAQIGGSVVDDEDGHRTRLFVTLEEPTPMPESVQVRLVRDGEIVVNADFEPNYEAADPGCDDDCVRAVRHFVVGG